MFHRVWGPVKPCLCDELVARSFRPIKSITRDAVVGWRAGRVACAFPGVRIARVSYGLGTGEITPVRRIAGAINWPIKSITRDPVIGLRAGRVACAFRGFRIARVS